MSVYLFLVFHGLVRENAQGARSAGPPLGNVLAGVVDVGIDVLAGQLSLSLTSALIGDIGYFFPTTFSNATLMIWSSRFEPVPPILKLPSGAALMAFI